MSFASPLSQKQKTVWSLISKGLSVSNVAGKLRTSRQYVNQTRLAAEAKLSKALMEAARINGLQVTRLYPKEAVLLGYHPVLKRKAIVTYTTSHGMKVWYWQDKPEEVTDEDFLKQTREYLIEVARERGMEIGEAAMIHPGRLAHIIFSELIPELKS